MADNPLHTASQLHPFLRFVVYVLEAAVKSTPYKMNSKAEICCTNLLVVPLLPVWYTIGLHA